MEDLNTIKLHLIGELTDAYSDRLTSAHKMAVAEGDTDRIVGILVSLMRGYLDTTQVILAMEPTAPAETAAPGRSENEQAAVDQIHAVVDDYRDHMRIGPPPVRSPGEQEVVDQLHDIVSGIGKGVGR